MFCSSDTLTNDLFYFQVDPQHQPLLQPVPKPRTKKKNKTTTKTKCESLDDLTTLIATTESKMYPRHHSLSQQQLGIPVLQDVATSSPFTESPVLLFPGYRPPANQNSQQPRFVQKTSSLPLQSPSPVIASPRTYYYYGGGSGSNRSSTIDSQIGLDNPLNLSQDSGLSPSPLENHQQHHHHQQQQQQQQHLYATHYENYRKISSSAGATPEPQSHRPTPESSLRSGRWPFSDFFRRSRKDVVGEEAPPPLPPKKRTNV